MSDIWFAGQPALSCGRPPSGTVSHLLGIEIIEVGPDFVRGRMPVDERTRQPRGLLHGGASVVLAETLMSAAGACCVDQRQQTVVGLEINANHIRGVRQGYVVGTARPLNLGRTMHVWETKIEDEAGHLVCVSRMTLAILSLRSGADQ